MRRGLLAASAVLLAGCSAASTSGTPHAASTPRTAASSRTATSTASARTATLHARVSTVMHLPSGISRTVAVVSGSRLLLLGGLAPGDSTTGRVVSVDVAARSSRVVGSLATAVHDACGAAVAGRVEVFGGGAATTVAAVQQWQPPSSHQVARLPAPRSDSSCATLGGTAYVAGGFDGHGMVTDVLATADGVHFRAVARLRQGVRYAAVAAVDHWLLVVGGALATTEGTATAAQSSLIQRVDLRTGQVQVIGHLSRPLAHATGVAVAGHVLVVGGRHGPTATADILTVDPVRGTVTRIGRLPQALSDAGVGVLGGTAYVVGGEASGPAAPASSVTAVAVAA